MNYKKILVALGVILIGIVVCLEFYDNKKEFIASESFNSLTNINIDDLPIEKEQVIDYINSQYVEYEETAGFTLVVNDVYNYKNYEYAYYIFYLSDVFEYKLQKEYIEEYVKVFLKYDFIIDELELDELYKLAALCKYIGYDGYNIEIKKALHKFYNPEYHLYFYEPYGDDGDEISIVSGYGATVYALKLQEIFGCEKKDRNDIVEHINENNNRYIDESESYYNLLKLYDILNLDIESLDIDFGTWIAEENKKIKNMNTYTYFELVAIRDLCEINIILGYGQQGIYEYIQSYGEVFLNCYSYDEESALINMTVIDICQDIAKEYAFTTKIENYINKSIMSKFINRDIPNVSPIYTYYGVVLSKIFDVEIDLSKIKTTIINDFLPNILYGDIKNDSYIMNAYFTIMLLDESEYVLEPNEKEEIINKINSLIKSVDVYDMTRLYQTLYTFQFSVEIARMLDVQIKNDNITIIKNFLSYIINNEMCVNKSMLSEIALIYDVIGCERPEMLVKQLDEMKATLKIQGGYCQNIGYQEPDIITTVKVYRAIECEDTEELRSFLKEKITDGYISTNGDVSQVDIRVYYSYIKLWFLR
ncbi:MAG: hypothetical protein IJ272_07985 [Clostridia bacterium]|nr:hypothetical protein [Clostridia bacterium]